MVITRCRSLITRSAAEEPPTSTPIRTPAGGAASDSDGSPHVPLICPAVQCARGDSVRSHGATIRRGIFRHDLSPDPLLLLSVVALLGAQQSDSTCSRCSGSTARPSSDAEPSVRPVAERRHRLHHAGGRPRTAGRTWCGTTPSGAPAGAGGGPAVHSPGRQRSASRWRSTPGPPTTSMLLIFTNTQPVWRLNTRGDYWVLDLAPASCGSSAAGCQALHADVRQVLPDGHRVAYVRENNLYVEDLASGAITPLTTDGSRTLINGTFDWVYEEELMNYYADGWRWSPDGRSIAYWQLNADRVKNFDLINNTDSLYSRVDPGAVSQGGRGQLRGAGGRGQRRPAARPAGWRSRATRATTTSPGWTGRRAPTRSCSSGSTGCRTPTR